MFAKVATDAALDKTFDYIIPPEFEDKVMAGSRVVVPFGKRTLEGYVLATTKTTEYDGKLREIKEVIGDRPWMSKHILKLVSWMASYYMAPIELCLKAVIPAPIRNTNKGDGFQSRLYIEALIEDEDKLTERVDLKLTERQHSLLSALFNEGAIPLSAFANEQKTTPATLRKLEERGLVKIFEKTERRDPLAGKNFLPSKPLPLTEEQANAKKIICEAINQACNLEEQPPKPILLFGVTASGKTEVFLQAIAEVLAAGKSAIVLVPEISLTPQTIQRFASRFGKITAVLHSKLSDGERHDEWHRIYTGEARVVVGPRSAVFAPVHNLGLIIVDEEHEPSYKQEEAPRYNARDIAVMRASYEHAATILGSATPSLESWHNAKNGKYIIASMPNRASKQMSKPNTIIIDMRLESMGKAAPPVFSKDLIDAIQRRLRTGEQVMLFLNRRGYAPHVTCPACGHTEECEDCATGMTYHIDDNRLRCHLCGIERSCPSVCPQCGNENYRFTGIGTQRIEKIAQKLFPNAKIQRMDADITSRKYSHEEILARFRAREIDILIGTQMITKGLDFPNVSLAGILNADSALHIPDFRAGERTFQLIAQMAGRTGRGLLPGDVYVQTQTPEAPAIKFAATENFDAFACQELDDRKELDYPPYSKFICITLRSESNEAVCNYAEKLASQLEAIANNRFRVLGPAPAPLERIKKYWRHQISIFTNKTNLVLAYLKEAQRVLPPPSDVGIAIDIDAMNTM